MTALSSESIAVKSEAALHNAPHASGAPLVEEQSQVSNSFVMLQITFLNSNKLLLNECGPNFGVLLIDKPNSEMGSQSKSQSSFAYVNYHGKISFSVVISAEITRSALSW